MRSQLQAGSRLLAANSRLFASIDDAYNKLADLEAAHKVLTSLLHECDTGKAREAARSCTHWPQTNAESWCYSQSRSKKTHRSGLKGSPG
ncbi:hypothetical protein D3C72_2165130 [compost metagenome]